MAMAVGSIVARQELIEDTDEVVIGAGPGLHDHEPGGGVWDEHVEQAIGRA
jgi:hypothetical protein